MGRPGVRRRLFPGRGDQKGGEPGQGEGHRGAEGVDHRCPAREGDAAEGGPPAVRRLHGRGDRWDKNYPIAIVTNTEVFPADKVIYSLAEWKKAQESNK